MGLAAEHKQIASTYAYSLRKLDAIRNVGIIGLILGALAIGLSQLPSGFLLGLGVTFVLLGLLFLYITKNMYTGLVCVLGIVLAILSTVSVLAFIAGGAVIIAVSVLLLKWWYDSKQRTTQEYYAVMRSAEQRYTPAAAPPPSSPVVHNVINVQYGSYPHPGPPPPPPAAPQQKVMMRCGYCKEIFDMGVGRCPRCGAGI